MDRSPSKEMQQPISGAWTGMEDMLLKNYVNVYGEGRWTSVSKNAGLKRSAKSCRFRWLNYLRPDIKLGNITPAEEDVIIRMHRLLGNRWSLIAGRLPGRTDNEIKNYWNTHMRKKTIKSMDLERKKSKNKSILLNKIISPPIVSRPTPTIPAEMVQVGKSFEAEASNLLNSKILQGNGTLDFETSCKLLEDYLMT